MPSDLFSTVEDQDLLKTGKDPERPGAVAKPLPEQLEAEGLLKSKGLRKGVEGGPLGFGQDAAALDSMSEGSRKAYASQLHASVGSAPAGGPSATKATAGLLQLLSKMRQGKDAQLWRYKPDLRRQLVVASVLTDSMDAASHQLTKGDRSGVEWYAADVDRLEHALVHVVDHHPALKALAGTFGRPDAKGLITSNPSNPLQNPRIVLFKALLAATSPMRNPVLNTQVAFDALRAGTESNPQSPFGSIPLKNPHPQDLPAGVAQLSGGHGWAGLPDPGPAFAVLNRLVNERGESGAAAWLLNHQPESELLRIKPRMQLRDIPDYNGTDAPGAYVFGPKAGPFFLNNNRNAAHVTKDIWFSRTWNRILGSLLTKDGKIQDVPRGPVERETMNEAVSRASKALGLLPHELQAVLWYHEQQLWAALGAKAPSYSYADGIASVARRAGLGGLPTAPSRRDADTRRRAAAVAQATTRRYRRRSSPRRYGRPGAADPTVLKHALGYLQSRGLAHEAVPDYAAIDPQRSKAIAAAYESMRHDPSHPAIRGSYDALKHETALQYQHLLDQGVKLEPWQHAGQPYVSSAEMTADARKGHLYFYTGGSMPSDHPLAAKAPIAAPDGSELSFNDLFRAVHDYYGHALYGNEFGPRGEEHAWRTHARMYSPAARPAMTAETRGQNSWVNFGAHLTPETPAADRPYAPQKAGLLPEEHSVPYGRKEPKRLYAADLSQWGAADRGSLAEDPFQPSIHGILSDKLEEEGDPEAAWHRWLFETGHAPSVTTAPAGHKVYWWYPYREADWAGGHKPTTKPWLPASIFDKLKVSKRTPTLRADQEAGTHTVTHAHMYWSPREAYDELHAAWHAHQTEQQQRAEHTARMQSGADGPDYNRHLRRSRGDQLRQLTRGYTHFKT